MQIVRITGGDYSKYESLLLSRDELEKEAEYILLEYIRVFGDITTEIFKLKIDCIFLKKSISYCVMLKNKGEEICPEKVQQVIAEKMTAYQAELEEMMKKNELSKNTEQISAYKVREIKSVYRKIAKLLHPDISNITEKHSHLADLFQRTIIAYHCNNYKEIKELELLVNSYLEKIGEENFELVIPNIEEKIEELEKEINLIKTTEPYIYNELLNSPERVNQKIQELEKERDSYSGYKTELEIKLKEIQEK